MSSEPQLLPAHAAPPPAPYAECSCPVPLPRLRAERKGAPESYCERCGLPVPLNLRRFR